MLHLGFCQETAFWVFYGRTNFSQFVSWIKSRAYKVHTPCALSICRFLHRCRPVMLTISTSPVVHMSRSKCMLVSGQGRWEWLWWPTKGCYLWHSWTMPYNLKHIQASLLLISTDWSRLRVAKVPRCRDLVIFMVTTDRQTDRPITLPLHMCTG